MMKVKENTVESLSEQQLPLKALLQHTLEVALLARTMKQYMLLYIATADKMNENKPYINQNKMKLLLFCFS